MTTTTMMIYQENKAVTSTPSAVAPGFRFHPTDEELVRYYLTRKVAGKICRIDSISDADIYKMEPWELPAMSKARSRDLEWYFYSALDSKYGNGGRMKRATNKGYWKATGSDRCVKHESRKVGMKKTLVFHKGRAPGGKRTNWVMHEYRLVDEELERLGAVKDGYVLCRVFQKSGLGPPNGDQYAHFDESEWDDDQLVLVSRIETVGEGLLSDEAEPHDVSTLEGNGQDEKNQDTQPETTDDKLKARGFLSPALVCKNERSDAWSLPSIVRPKRPRLNSSDSSKTPVPKCPSSLPSDPSLSIKAASTKADPESVGATTLLDLPIVKSDGAKENLQITPSNWIHNTTFNWPVHPSYVNLINNLRNEFHSTSAERDILRTEMMHAQRFIDVLQSRVNCLLEENEYLKWSGRNV